MKTLLHAFVLVFLMAKLPLLAQFTIPLGVDGEGAGMELVNLDGDPRPELLLMVYEKTSTDNKFRYKIGWNVNEKGEALSWSSISIPVSGVGWAGQGASITTTDLDRNGRPELVLMAYDSPNGPNTFRYKIGWNLTTYGLALSWSDPVVVEGVGWEGQGAGIAFANIDSGNDPEMILMAYDNPTGGNTFRYKVGWNVNQSGIAHTWSEIIEVQGVGGEADGADIAVVDLDNNQRPELIFMAYTNPARQNDFQYKIGWNLKSSGKAINWSAPQRVNGLGWTGLGAGIAAYDLDGSGDTEALFMAYSSGEDPASAYAFRYRMIEDILKPPHHLSPLEVPYFPGSFYIDPAKNEGTRSANRRYQTKENLMVRMPVLFVKFPDDTLEIDEAQAWGVLRKAEKFFEETSHGRLDLEFRHEIISLNKSSEYRNNLPVPVYDKDGNLTNGAEFPSTAAYDGYKCIFYFPMNVPIVGDFNGDGYDDVGARWIRGDHAGTWYISLNNRLSKMGPGTLWKVGGSEKSYTGDNTPIIGDFNGDGYDDIGVKWIGGTHEGKWVISLNNKMGGFDTGKLWKVGGGERAYRGDNTPIIGDFNGDGYDDIGVKWVSGVHNGKWVISLNNKQGGFETGQHWITGYIGENAPIVGDFNRDGYDDIGVKWTGGVHDGKWVISLNNRQGSFDAGVLWKLDNNERAFPGRHIPLTGNLNGDGYEDIIVRWVDNENYDLWTAAYNSYGRGFRNVSELGRMYENYSILFKNANGNLDWENNSNVFRNYCDRAGINYTTDAVNEWLEEDPASFQRIMNWARSSSDKGPVISFLSHGFGAGGVRGYSQAQSLGGYSFHHYLFSNLNLQNFFHEIGHFIGHYHELYQEGDQYGKLAYEIMGIQKPGELPAFSALNRWRFGFTRARYISPQNTPTTVRLTLSPSLSKTSADESIVVVQPDPLGHPDEVFVLENRRPIHTTVLNYPANPPGTDSLNFNLVDPEGLFIYHLNADGYTPERPLMALETNVYDDKPYQGHFTATSLPNSNFYDGKRSGLRITGIQQEAGGAISLTISFADAQMNAKPDTMETQMVVPSRIFDNAGVQNYTNDQLPVVEPQDAFEINRVQLEQNAPNPFSTQTTIRFSLPAATSDAQLMITTLSGKVVNTYTLEPGRREQVIDRAALPPGIYLYSLIVDGKFLGTKKMIISN